MESITHLTRKLLQERARQQPAAHPDTAPPPYCESSMDSDDDDDMDDEVASSPIKLVINAAHNIHGSNNLVATSPAPLADASKFSTLLLHAVNQINAANAAVHGHGDETVRPRRARCALKVDLTINCGITIIGDRNVVGNVGLKPKLPVTAQSTASTTSAVAGAKRKADDFICEAVQAPAKKSASGENVEE